MKYTIPNRRFVVHRQWETGCGIMLPNGAKCNSRFWWACVSLGILTMEVE